MAKTKQDFMPLMEVPCEYVSEKCQWHDWKRTLTDLGLTWNLPDWSSTIVHRGKDWKEIVHKGTNLEDYFPPPKKGVMVDGEVKEVKIDLVALLGLPAGKNDNSTTFFCNLGTLHYEAGNKLSARQKFWNWMVRSLKGIRANSGPYYYIVAEVQVYDISGIYKRLGQVLEPLEIL